MMLVRIHKQYVQVFFFFFPIWKATGSIRKRLFELPVSLARLCKPDCPSFCSFALLFLIFLKSMEAQEANRAR